LIEDEHIERLTLFAGVVQQIQYKVAMRRELDLEFQLQRQ
jgi:hypothetical protein